MTKFTVEEEMQIQELMKDFFNRPAGLPSELVAEAASRLLEIDRKKNKVKGYR